VAPCSKLPKTDLNVRIGKNKNPFQEREKWRTVVSSAMPLLLLSNPVGASGFGELVEARAKNTHCNVLPRVTLRFTILRGRIYIVVPGCKSYARITTEVAPVP